MKKNLLRLIIMSTKYSLYGFVISCMMLTSLMAANSHAQEIKSVKEVRVKLAFDQVTLMEAFNKIEQATNFHFIFNDYEIDQTLKISTSNRRGQMLSDLLMDISRQANLQFKQVNKNISVKRLPEQEMKKVSDIEVIIQTRTITGKVISVEDGEGLPGVNVVEKGTTNGTVTDVQGNYSLEVSYGATIVFSSVGYTQEEVVVGNRSTIDLTMTQDIQQLQELVVVGYGTQRRSDLTGSVASVSPKELKEVAIVSLDQGLQGRVAGVQVSQSSAAPGGSVSVRIRGVNSINGNNEPLYVVDGIPIISNDFAVSPTNGGIPGAGGGGLASNALASINPNDIESIEVLKDASAAAIYGARGANGVVIITTKQGKAGRTTIDFENYYGIQQVTRQYDLLNARQFGIMVNEFSTSQGADPIFSQMQIDSLGNTGTNWQEAIFRDAPIQDHQLTITSGNEKTTFALGANYFRQEGVVKESGFERASLRLNLNHMLGSKVKIGTNLMASRLVNNRVNTDGDQSVTASAQQAPPIVPVFNTNGNYTIIEEYASEIDDQLIFGDILNPLSSINEVYDNETTNRLLSNFYAEYEIIEGLSFKSTAGVNISNRGRDTYYGQRSNQGERAGGVANTGTSERLILLNENTLSFNKIFGNKHQFNAVTGFTTQYEVLQGRSIVNSGFGIDDPQLNLNDISSGTNASGPTINSFKQDESLASFILRATYIFDDRYLLTVTGRADGSSKFSEGNKWGIFPSVALGWKMKNESFLQQADWLSNLKLRASYGETGFQEIGPYQSLARYQSQNYSFGGTPVIGYQPLSPVNRNLTWQTTLQSNIGLDVTILNNKFSFTADFYVKSTENLLLFVSPPANTGYATPLPVNVGEVRNTGWELSMGSNQSFGKITWNSNFNISGNLNEVIDLGNQQEIFGGRLSSSRRDDGNLTRVGEPIGIFYGFVTDGIFKNQQEVDAQSVQPDAQPGDRRFVDTNKNGEIDGGDRTKIGDPYPDFIFGWSNNFQMNRFDLSFFFQGAAGNDILNVGAEPLIGSNTRSNLLVERFEQRWTQENTDARFPAIGSFDPIIDGSGGFGDYAVEDGSYIRLRDVTLGYSLANDNVNWLRTARIYFSVQNAFTITNYTGLNPDISSRGQSATNFGVDLGGYPVSRIYRLGVNLGF